jgi:hypothetical protein
MRKLIARDIAPFTKVLAKMEMKDAIKNMFSSNKERGDMIAELVWGVIENYYKAEQDFFAFMADLNEKTAEEISVLPLDDFINLIKELFNEKNLSFFKSAVR